MAPRNKMSPSHGFSTQLPRYTEALRARLRGGSPSGADIARELFGPGRRLLTISRVLALAKEHEEVMLNELAAVSPGPGRDGLVRQGGDFFAAMIAGASPTPGEARMARAIVAMSRRNVALAASKAKLGMENAKCKSAEKALKASERHCAESLALAEVLKLELRDLSRQMLSAQEEERKRISRELHDVVAQALTGINLRLAALKIDAARHSKNLDRKIAGAQRLVARSTDIVHRFVRELRPPALDELGLLAALHSYVKPFTERFGIRVHIEAYTGTEHLDTRLRTVLFRVAQEALVNVARHARASAVDLVIIKDDRQIMMRISDDGTSAGVPKGSTTSRSRCLGVLGMRERVQMIGGTFRIESKPGKGTCVEVRIPMKKGDRPGRKP